MKKGELPCQAQKQLPLWKQSGPGHTSTMARTVRLGSSHYKKAQYSTYGMHETPLAPIPVCNVSLVQLHFRVFLILQRQDYRFRAR